MKLFCSASAAAFTFMTLSISAAEPAATAGKFDAAVSPGDSVVAKGNGFVISRREIDQLLATARAEHPQDQLPPDAEIHALSQLIEIQLVLEKATASERAEGMDVTNKRVGYILKTLGQAEFEHRLRITDMSADDLRIELFQEETAQTSLTRQLGINVTDADAKKFFDAHPGAYDQPVIARVRELLLLTTVGYSSAPLPSETVNAKHELILNLHKRIQGGADFAALARQYNEDPVSKDSGGVFLLRKNQMEFGDLAFSMKPNQISDVLMDEDGYRILQLLEIIPPKKIEYAAIADKLKNALIGEEKRRLAPAYIQKLRKEADVEILDAKLKAAFAAYDAEVAAGTQKPADVTNLLPATSDSKP
jgi:parvulin-like peptidyl-prolyl isomerase